MKKYLPAIIAVILIIAVGAAAYVMGSKKADKPAGTETAMSQQDQGTLPDVSTDGRTPQLKGIAVVDVVALMRTSNAARSIEEQLNAKRKSYQEELAGQEKKLEAIPGVVCAGIFGKRRADLLLLGTPGGVKRVRAGSKTR